MKIIKPCKTCGSTDKYSNGGCRPCQRAKQAIRNQNDRLPNHIEDERRAKKNNELKADAKARGDKHFVSETACYRCGKFTRYVCNHACIYCS